MRSERESTEERRGLHSEEHVIRCGRLVITAASAAYLNDRVYRIGGKGRPPPGDPRVIPQDKTMTIAPAFGYNSFMLHSIMEEDSNVDG
jgi:hypothetical protein